MNTACNTVASGGVGESGNSVTLTHSIPTGIRKLVVLRHTGSSLCPNTGAIGLLVVNGMPQAMGDLAAPGSSIQAEVGPFDNVVAVVHAIPLFNGVSCIRLGELCVSLDECDLVGLDQSPDPQVDCQGVETRNWYSWLNRMPPPPDNFHVSGEVQVPNPGVEVELRLRSPQGINPSILQLELVLTQSPGIWTQQLTWKEARYNEDPTTSCYESVDIFCGDAIIAQMPVQIVQ